MPRAYLLDTNVLSEIMRPRPNPRVIDWIDAHGAARLGTSVIAVLEIRYGLETLAAGRRRASLDTRFGELIDELLKAGVFDLTRAAAERCAAIMAAKRARSESLDAHLPDAIMAGIAATSGCAVATRNEAEFRNTGVTVVNPWTGPAP